MYAYNVEKVIGLEVIDASTIKIDLSEPVPFFEYNLTFPILPNNYYLGEDFYNSAKTPIGTGKYKIVLMDGTSIILGKNDKWWNINNQPPRIEAINIKLFSEMGEVYNSFKLGNLDIITTSNNQVQNYIGTIGYTKHEFKGRDYTYLAFNCQDSVLKNDEVRKAISYSIDRNNVVTSTFGTDRIVSNYPLDYGSFLYTEGKLNFEYNQDQAKRVLMQQGWEYKYNTWRRQEDDYSTSKIELTLTVNRDDAGRVSVAENIKNQLEQVGMKITLRQVSASQYNDILDNKNYEMILTGVYNSFTPSLETFFGNNNIQNYYNNDITNLLNQSKNTNDLNTLKECNDKIIDIYNNDLPFISLYRDKSSVIKSQNISGEITPNNYFSYYNINTWSRF